MRKTGWRFHDSHWQQEFERRFLHRTVDKVSDDAAVKQIMQSRASR